MAANDSLQYLSALQSIEIRAYTPNEDKLLGMVGSSSTTICVRAPGSHDLVIKDLTGDSKFCVGGTEIKNHPISVYYREGQTIGTIESNKLKLTGENRTADISISVPIFTVAGNKIEGYNTHITISFNQRAAVEMKAMVIAFAIQEALAYDFLQKSLPVGLVSPQSASNSSIVPKQNKQAISMFNDEENQTYYVKLGGRSGGTKEQILFYWMDNSERQNIVSTAIANSFYILMSNTIGEPEYSVTVDPNSSKSYVISQSTTIGEIDINKQGRKCLSTKSGPSSKSEMYLEGNPEEGTIIDSSQVELASYTRSGATSQKVTFLKLTANQKKVVSANFIQKMFRIIKRAKNSPQIMLTMLTCNCKVCEQPRQSDHQLDRQNVINSFNLIKNLTVAVVGHNSAKNLVYYNVFNEAEKTTCLTLECTPIEKFRGFVTLVAKEAYGEVMFKAVVLPDDVLAIYSHEDKLLGYHYKEHVFDDRENVIMENHNQERKGKFGTWKSNESVEYILRSYDDRRKLAVFQGHIYAVHIFQPGFLKRTSLFHTAVVLAFAVKLYCDAYHYDQYPSPEISYRYKGSTGDAKRIGVM